MRPHSRVFAESLEPRLLCKVPTYNFGSLTGYTATKADWTYDYHYALKADALGSDSGDGRVLLRAKRTGTGADRRFTLTASSDTGASVKVYQADAQGLNVLQLRSDAGNARITINLAGTRVAPASVTLGKAYTDAGTYTGSFTGTGPGVSVNGSVAGRATSTTQLLSIEALSTPAGAFDTAVKGTQTVALNGTLRITANGQSATVSFAASFSTTFWAVKNVGIVRSKEAMVMNFSFAGRSARVSLAGNSRLAASSLIQPATPPALKRAPVFSTTPLLPSPDPIAP